MNLDPQQAAAHALKVINTCSIPADDASIDNTFAAKLMLRCIVDGSLVVAPAPPKDAKEKGPTKLPEAADPAAVPSTVPAAVKGALGKGKK